MIGRAIGVTVLMLAFLDPSAWCQSVSTGRLRGRVMEDGRPIQRIVEIRLEGDASGLVDTAYTQASEEFDFPAVRIDFGERYFLVIREPGYTEVRYQLQPTRAPFGRVEFGLVTLNLNSLPSEETVPDAGAGNTVDLRQLTAEIPDRARDAYREGLEHLDQGDSEAGLVSLELAVRLAPEYYDALNKLGVEYLTRQRYGDAKQVLERAYGLNRNDPILLIELYLEANPGTPDRESMERVRDAIRAAIGR